MKAYAFTGPSRPLALKEKPTPTPTGTEVLVHTRYCGVCHSDVHLHEGAFDLGGGEKLELPLPEGTVFGHEVYGEVVAVGDAVCGVEPGQTVVVYPWIGCGNCPPCLAGYEHMCQGGLFVGGGVVDGGFSDHVLVSHERYCFDAGGIDPERAGSLACAGLTSFGAIKRISDLGADSKIVVIGAGGLGMMAIGLLNTAFGVKPIAVDIDDAKLEAATAAGAGAVVNSRDPAAMQTLQELTGGGADAAIDFVGSEQTAPLGFHSLRVGGKLVIVGLFGGELRLPLALIPMTARTIEGSQVGTLAQMQELMALARAGKVPPIPVTVRPAAEADDVIEALRNGQVLGRAVLRHD